MGKVIKRFNEELKDVKLVGHLYSGEDLKNLPLLWNKWFTNDMFSPLDKIAIDDSYVGLMKWPVGDYTKYVYLIGVLAPLEAKVPEGYAEFKIPNAQTVTYYIKGVDGPSLYEQEGPCFQDFIEKEQLFVDEENNGYCFEKYNCPRFTTPDENNEVILDYIILKKSNNNE